MTFQPNQSGNPNGRPKGIIDKRTKLRGLLESHADEIIEKLIELAKAGDSNALRLCIERLLPRAKPDEGIYFDLPEGRLDTGDNMLRIAHDLTQAVVTGQFTLQEAFKFSNFINLQRRHVENAEQQQQNELEREERQKAWAARYKEETDDETSN